MKETNIDVDLDLLHSEMLEIAKEFDKFCTANDLSYFICGGSLLGAIRHNGFIPWDDDFDVAMPRKCYQEFLKKWVDLDTIKHISIGMPGYYKVGTPSKLHNPKYVIEEKYDVENGMPKYNPYGIFIDIFPLDNYPDTFTGRLINKYVGRILQIKEFSKFTMKKRSRISRLIFKLFKLVPECFISAIYRKSQHLITKKSTKRFWGYGIESPVSNLIADEEHLFPLAQIKFSDLNLNAPNNPDVYLKMRFGDYMKLPEQKDRQTHIASIKKL